MRRKFCYGDDEPSSSSKSQYALEYLAKRIAALLEVELYSLTLVYGKIICGHTASREHP
jgi:hypothetical protein